MILDVQFYSQFKRDIKLAKKRHLNIDLLKAVIETLRTCEKLDEKYRYHALTGDYIGYRECHIQPDWLLVYKVVENRLLLILARTGTHSDLF